MKGPRRAIFAHPLYADDEPAPPPPLAHDPPARWLRASAPAATLAPGLVVLKGALGAPEQLYLARLAMQRGAQPEPRGFWATRAGPPGGTPPRREPNSSANCGRGRAYDAIGQIGNSPPSAAHPSGLPNPGVERALRALAAELVGAACAADAAMPRMDPTHVLLVHYSRGQHVTPRIGWHKDDAPNDGRGESPVVALSLGEAADFVLCAGWSRARQKALESAGQLHRVRLESGDAILFGGPLRYAHHAVAKTHAGTCPAPLLPVLGEARVSLTFRDAPGVDARDYETYRPNSAEGVRARAAATQAQGCPLKRRRTAGGSGVEAGQAASAEPREGDVELLL